MDWAHGITCTAFAIGMVLAGLYGMDMKESKEYFIKHRITIAVILTLYIFYICFFVHHLHARKTEWTMERILVGFIEGPANIASAGIFCMLVPAFILGFFEQCLTLGKSRILLDLVKSILWWICEITSALLIPIMAVVAISIIVAGWITASPEYQKNHPFEKIQTEPER